MTFYSRSLLMNTILKTINKGVGIILLVIIATNCSDNANHNSMSEEVYSAILKNAKKNAMEIRLDNLARKLRHLPIEDDYVDIFELKFENKPLSFFLKKYGNPIMLCPLNVNSEVDIDDGFASFIPIQRMIESSDALDYNGEQLIVSALWKTSNNNKPYLYIFFIGKGNELLSVDGWRSCNIPRDYRSDY